MPFPPCRAPASRPRWSSSATSCSRRRALSSSCSTSEPPYPTWSNTLESIGRAEALCVCGPSGTGKSHLVEALGHLAIDRGRTVAWQTLESLAGMLRRHRADDSASKAISRLIRADLIVIDLCRDRDYADPVMCRIFEVPAKRLLLGVRAGPVVGIVSRPDETTSS